MKIKRTQKERLKVHKRTTMTITRRLPAFPPQSLLHLPASLSPTLFSEGHRLKVAHFFLKEAKLAY